MVNVPPVTPTKPDGERGAHAEREHEGEERAERPIQHPVQHDHEEHEEREILVPARARVVVEVGVDVGLADLAHGQERRRRFLVGLERAVDAFDDGGALLGGLHVEEQRQRQHVRRPQALLLEEIGAGDERLEPGGVLGRGLEAALDALVDGERAVGGDVLDLRRRRARACRSAKGRRGRTDRRPRRARARTRRGRRPPRSACWRCRWRRTAPPGDRASCPAAP